MEFHGNQLWSGACGGQWHALRGNAGSCGDCAARWNGNTASGSVVLGAGVVSLGDSAECARGAKKPHPTPISNFFKKITPEQ